MDRVKIFLTSFSEWWGHAIVALGAVGTLVGLQKAVWPAIRDHIIRKQQATIRDQREQLMRMAVHGTLQDDVIALLETQKREAEEALIEHKKRLDRVRETEVDEILHSTQNPQSPPSGR